MENTPRKTMSKFLFAGVREVPGEPRRRAREPEQGADRVAEEAEGAVLQEGQAGRADGPGRRRRRRPGTTARRRRLEAE